MDTNGKPGRRPTLLVAQRKAIVEARMHDGLTVMEISALRLPTGAKLGNYKTIAKDYKEARSRILEQDGQWFLRAREARIKGTRRLEGQYKRLLGIVLQGEGYGYTSAEVTHVESLLTKTVDTLYSIESDFDPEQYYGHLEKVRTYETNAEGKNRDSQPNPPERASRPET